MAGPTPSRVLAIAFLPAASMCVLTGWAALDSLALAYRLIKNR